MTTHGGRPQRRHWADWLDTFVDNPWTFLVLAILLAVAGHFIVNGVRALT